MATLDEQRLEALLAADRDVDLWSLDVDRVIVSGRRMRRRQQAAVVTALVAAVGAGVAAGIVVSDRPSHSHALSVTPPAAAPPAVTSQLLADNPPIDGHYVTLWSQPYSADSPASGRYRGIAYVSTDQDVCYGQLDRGTGDSSGVCVPLRRLRASGLQGPVDGSSGQPLFTVALGSKRSPNRAVFGVYGDAPPPHTPTQTGVAVTVLSSDGNDPADESPSAARMGATGTVASHIRVWSSLLPLRTGAHYRAVVVTRLGHRWDAERFVLGQPSVVDGASSGPGE